MTATRRGIPGMAPLLTSSQAAALLGVSDRTLQRMRARAQISAVGSIGQALLFDELAVAALRQQLEASARGGGKDDGSSLPTH